MTAYYSLYSSTGLKKFKTLILIFVMVFGKLLDASAQSASPYCDFQVLSFSGIFGYDNSLGNNFWITGLTTSGSGVVTANNFSGGTSNAAMPSAGFDQGVYLTFGATVTQTQAPTFTMTRPGGSNACIFHVLVDWNNDNDLADAGEEIITSGTIAAATTTFTTSAYTIPILAPTGGNNTAGSHRMRIICEYQGETQRIPCGAGGSSGAQGNAKDFTLTVVAATACSGNPPQLTVAPASVGVCSGTSTTLNVTGIAASGYTFQWQQSQTSGGPYTNATGASTNSSYTTPTTLPFNPTYYVCQVTCSNSGLTTQSTESTVNLNSFVNCYCIGSYAAANGGTRGITQIILNGTPGINNPSAVNNTAPYYTLYTGASPVSNAGLSAGSGYTLSVKVGSQAASSNNVGAWIDYNQDGVFSSTEFLGSFSSAAANSTTNINFTVPVTALSGITAMRVRHRYGAAVGATDACTSFSGAAGGGGAGETEDYLVNIASCTPPSVQSSGNSMGSINTTDATINWTGNGNGDAVLVVLNQGSVPSGPAQATAYTGNSNFTLAPVVSGTTRAIYAGTGNSVNVTGLITNTTYFYSIYTYFTGTNCYNVVSPASGSFTTANSPMITTAQAVTQASTSTITPGSTNNQILQLRIDCSPGTAPALVVTQLVFSTTAVNGGTTNPADIANAKVFYTGSISTFSSATQYGSTVVNPNGSFTVSGSTALAPGSNYFWLTYDIVAVPTINDFVDAQLTAINIGSIINPLGDPAGNRQITLTYCIPVMPTFGAVSGQTNPFPITVVSFGTLNATGMGGVTPNSSPWYQLMSQTGSVTESQTYTLNVQRQTTGYTVSALVYADWNHNGILNDPGEVLMTSGYGSSTSVSANITVPLGALPGSTRLRVINLFQPSVIDPCNPNSSGGFNAQGETKDFNITVIGGCIAPVISCRADTTTCDIHVVTWTPPTATGTSPTIVCSPVSGSTFPTGTTLVTCTATNSCGSSSCSFNVTVSPIPAISASNSAPFCEGTQNLQLNATAPGGGTFLWTGPGGYTSSIEDPVRTSTTAAMSGTYSVKVTDANGCTNTATTNVTIHPLPVIGIVVIGRLSTHLCIGDTSVLEGTGAGASGTYLWSTSQTGGNIIITAGGTYSVTGTDLHGCINVSQVTLTQSAPPAAPIIVVAAGDSNLCTSDGNTYTSVTLHTTNYNDPNMEWNTGFDLGPDLTVSYLSDFNVTIKDAFTCTSVSNTISTHEKIASTAPVNSQLSSNVAGNVTCAVPVTLTLTPQTINLAAPGYLGSDAHWEWFLDGSSCGTGTPVGTGAVITVTPPTTPGPHTYSVRAVGYCNTTSCASIVIIVKDPSVDPTSASASSSVICEGDQTVLSVSGGSLGTGANWKLYENTCGGAALQTSSSPSFTVTPQSPGLHTYYIRGEGDCNNTVCNTIVMDVKDSSAQAVSLSSSATDICEGTSITMNIGGGHLGRGAVWSWYEEGCGTGAALQSNSSTSLTITPLTGLHTYYVRAEGDCNNTLCQFVTVNVKDSSEMATSSLASPAVICEGSLTTLSASGGHLGTGASWKLYENTCGGAAIQTSSSPSFTVTPQSPGLHTYYIRAEGDCNNTVCNMIVVDVKDSSAQAVSLSSSATDICEGTSITMNIGGGHLGRGGVWSWYEGGCGNGAALQSSSSTSLTLTPLTGLHTYYVRAEGDCNNTLCQFVTVNVKDSSEMATSSLASPAVICEGDQTTLSASGGHLGTGAAWMLYENTCGGVALQSSSSPSFTLTPQSPGLHTYFIRAEGDCNNTVCSMIVVDVKDSSAQAVSLSSSATDICEGTSITMNIGGGHLGRGAVWSWYEGGCGNGAALQSSSATSLTLTPLTGLHTYYVRAEGDCNNTLCQFVTVNVKDSSEMATSSLASPAVICEGSPTTLSASGGHLGTGASWKLYENTCGGVALQTSSSPSFTLTPQSPGLHTYFIRAEGDCNNTVCSMIVVDVKDSSAQAASLSSSATDICVGTSVTMNIGGGHLGRGAVWNWYEGGCGSGAALQSSTSTSLTVTPTPGLHTYYVRAEGDCNTTLCQSITVNVKVFSVAPVSASALPSVICSGDLTTLSVSGGALGTNANWKWYAGSCGGALVGIGASVQVNPVASTVYFVRAEGDCNTTNCVSVSVTVQTSSTDPTSATSNAPVNGICIGGSVILSVSGGTLGIGAVYKWYEDGCGNGASIGTGASITITPAFEGLHSYYVRAEGPCNMTNCAAVQVLVGTFSVAATNITSTVPGNSICVGNNLLLTVNGGFLGTVAQWKWYSASCGGALVGTGPTITVNPAVTTNYYVRAEGSCNSTTCVTTTVYVSTNAPSQHANIIQSPQSICSGNQGTFTCQTVSNATYYSWSAPNGTTFNGNNPSPYITTVPTVNVTFGVLPNGVSGYDICVFAGNGCGTSATKCKHVNGRTITPQIISGNASSCPNTSSVYSCVSSPGADSYLWTITGNATFSNGNDSIVTTGTSVTVNFGPGWTNGLLSVFAQMNCGYSSPAKTITIVSTPVVPGVITGPAMVCPNGSYNFSIAPVTGATGYNWSTNVPGAIIGAGTTSRNITFPAVIPAGSTVSVTATGSCGTSAPQIKNIATGLANAPGTISGPATGVCGQTGVGYSILPVAGATSYLWTATNGASINGINNITTASVDFPALFTNCAVSVVAINGCGNSAPQTKNVTGAPASPGPITGTGAVCVGNVYNYSVTGSAGATAYVWSSPGGSLILSGQNTASISVLYLDNSGGTVSVFASNACGNSSSSTFAVSVTCRQAQITQGSLIDATLYPNPTVGSTTLSFETITAGDYKVCILDMTGQIMQTSIVTAVEGWNFHELDLSTYAKGLYMVRLEREGEAMQVLRLTVE